MYQHMNIYGLVNLTLARILRETVASARILPDTTVVNPAAQIDGAFTLISLHPCVLDTKCLVNTQTHAGQGVMT